MQNQTEQNGRRSYKAYGCIVSSLLALLIVAWIASGFFIWKNCEIPLPDGSGSVVYMARLNKIPSAEWDRKVQIRTNHTKPRIVWIPSDPSGAWPVNVYWYPEMNNQGPYIRFHDPVWEYLIDIRHGTTLDIVHDSKGQAYVREITGGRAASGPGRYIGRVEYPFNHYVPKSESPEEPLPEH